MRILAMDTATAAMSIAWTTNGKLIDGSVVATERNHSIRLAPEIDTLLNKNQIPRKTVEGIACGVGPGSYTGVRIGVTVSKTMAWALGIPVWELSSMHILAWSAWERFTQHTIQPTWIVPIADARRGQVFTGLYEVAPSNRMTLNERETTNFSLRALESDRVAPLEQWLDQIIQIAQTKGQPAIVVAGEVTHFQTLHATYPNVQWMEAHSSAVGLAKTVEDMIVLGEQMPASVHDLAPNYTQLAEAESKWLANQSNVKGD